MHVDARRASGEVVAVDALARKVMVRTRDGWLVPLYAAELASAHVTLLEPGSEAESRKRDSRWRDLTERLNIFRRRPGRLPGGPEAEPPKSPQEGPP
jgi:hypothetical protein